MCTFDSPVILLLVVKLWDLLVATNILGNQLPKTKINIDCNSYMYSMVAPKINLVSHL